MFLFESSKDKQLKEMVYKKFYECVGTDGKKFEDNKNLLISYCKNSQKPAIQRMVQLIKANIKDDDIDVKQKLLSLFLLRDAMLSRNKALGNYVVEKILKRLIILAKFKKESQDPQRGRELFGKRKKQQQQMAARFHTTLLQCIVDWGNNWPREDGGSAKAFKRALDELIKQKVALVPVRDVSPKPRQQNPAGPTSKPQQQPPSRRMEQEVRRGGSRNQSQIQQSISRNQSNSGVVPSQKQVKKQSSEPSPKFDAQLVRFMSEINSNFELLASIIQQPQAQSTCVFIVVIRQVVRGIEKGFQGQPRLDQILTVKSPVHESAAQIVGGDFGFIEKINKDLLVIERKPQKVNIFKEKYERMLNSRQAKYANFIAQLNDQSQSHKRQQQQLAEAEPGRRPSRQSQREMEGQPVNRRESERQMQQMKQIEQQREIQRRRQLEKAEERRLQAEARKQKQAQEIYLKKMQELRRQAQVEEARRREEEQEKRKLSEKNISKSSVEDRDKEARKSLEEFNQFAAANPVNPSVVKSDQQFQQFQANLDPKGSAEDFFGASYVPTQQIRKSGGLEDSIVQNERQPVSSLKKFEADPFEGASKRELGSSQTGRKLQEPANPFASTQQKEWTNPFLTETKRAENRSVEEEPENPFEEVQRKQTIQSISKTDWTNPFERMKQGEVTNPFEQSVISQITEKTNPFQNTAQQSPKMNDFQFLNNLRGSIDSNNAQQNNWNKKVQPPENDNPFSLDPFKKKPTNQQRMQMNPFDAFTTIEAKPDRDSDFNVQFFEKSRKSESQFGDKLDDPFANFGQEVQGQKPKQPLFPSVDMLESADFLRQAQQQTSDKKRFYTEQAPREPAEQKKYQTLEPAPSSEIQRIPSPKHLPTISPQVPQQVVSPKSAEEIKKQYEQKVIKIDPTNPVNNPFGDPTKVEEKAPLEKQLEQNIVIELDFFEFKAVKKIGIPWNPFTKKSSPSPTKNELLLKMHLDKLTKSLNEIRRVHEEEQQVCILRHRGFLQARNQYMEKKKQLEEAEKSKSEYGKMIITIEEDITRKQRLIANEFRKVELLNKLKEQKNNCLRRLFECQNKRKTRLSELPNGAMSRNSANKFKVFNETARSFHNIVSMSATSRSRMESFATVLTKTRY